MCWTVCKIRFKDNAGCNNNRPNSRVAIRQITENAIDQDSKNGRKRKWETTDDFDLAKRVCTTATDDDMVGDVCLKWHHQSP